MMLPKLVAFLISCLLVSCVAGARMDPVIRISPDDVKDFDTNTPIRKWNIIDMGGIFYLILNPTLPGVRDSSFMEIRISALAEKRVQIVNAAEPDERKWIKALSLEHIIPGFSLVPEEKTELLEPKTHWEILKQEKTDRVLEAIHKEHPDLLPGWRPKSPAPAPLGDYGSTKIARRRRSSDGLDEEPSGSEYVKRQLRPRRLVLEGL